MGKVRNISTNVILTIFVLVLLVFLMELAVRIFFPQPTQYFYFKFKWMAGEKFTRWGDIEIRINSHGQRDYERTLEKPEGTYRIAILGDSIAFGTGVSIEDTYAKRLESLLNDDSNGRIRFEVLTFTNGGSEPTGYLKMLREDALRFSPDLVIVSFTLNDFERQHVEKTPRESFYDMLRYMHMRMRVASHLYFLIFERSRSLLYKYRIIDKSVRRGYELSILETEGREFEEAWRFTRKNVRRIRELSNKGGARFMIVVFPYEMQLSKELLDFYRDALGFRLSDSVLKAKPQQLLRNYSKDEGTPLIDIFEPFRSKADRGLYFREFGGALDFVHPNARGHEIAGRVLYDALRCSEALPIEVREDLPRDDCKDRDFSGVLW